MAPMSSAAYADGSASVSWALRDSRRTQRPNATSGSTIAGMASSTKPESRGLVITIIAVAPTNSRKLRSAIDTEAPTADLIWVVSAVNREISSPLRAESKNAGDSEHRDHRDHDAEVVVDPGDAFGRETEIDHPPRRDRHQQGRDRGDRQRDQCETGATAVARHIRRQRQQWTKPRAALGRRLR